MTTGSSTRRTPVTDTASCVLDSALHLFSTRGYFSTSIHDIRKASGVSIGSIYHHFGNKEALARALYQHLLSRLNETLQTIVASEGNAQERCRAVVMRLFELSETEPEALGFVLHARHREFLPDEPPICSSAPFQALRDLVEQGMAAGEVRRMDVRLAAACLFGGPLRCIHLRLDGVIERALPELIDEVWPCAWRSVAAPENEDTPNPKRKPK